LRIAAVSRGGAIAYASRQPVTEYVFDSPLMVTVRSRIPGRLASATCGRPS